MQIFFSVSAISGASFLSKLLFLLPRRDRSAPLLMRNASRTAAPIELVLSAAKCLMEAQSSTNDQINQVAAFIHCDHWPLAFAQINFASRKAAGEPQRLSASAPLVGARKRALKWVGGAKAACVLLRRRTFSQSSQSQLDIFHRKTATQLENSLSPSIQLIGELDFSGESVGQTRRARCLNWKSARRVDAHWPWRERERLA